jgi:hypothetical protein
MRVEDVSQTGARLMLKSSVAEKDEIEITFEAPGVPLTKRAGNIV